MLTVGELIERLSALPSAYPVGAKCEGSDMWDLRDVVNNEDSGVILVFGECWYP